jgi:predicted amidophosphoribosyltransferase
MKTPTKLTCARPILNGDGTCPACIANAGNGPCQWCHEETERDAARRSAACRKSSAFFRARDIADICARYELESDERGTREDHAARMLGALN